MSERNKASENIYMGSNRQLLALLPTIIVMFLSSSFLEGVWWVVYNITILVVLSFLYKALVKKWCIGRIDYWLFVALMWGFQALAIFSLTAIT